MTVPLGYFVFKFPNNIYGNIKRNMKGDIKLMDFDMVIYRLLEFGIPIFCIFTIVKFIRDGKNAKIEGRRRKVRYIVLFILGLIVLLLYLAMATFLILITIDIRMNGM